MQNNNERMLETLVPLNTSLAYNWFIRHFESNAYE